MTAAPVRVIASGRAAPSPSMFPAAARAGSGVVLAYSTVPDGWPGGEVHVIRQSDGSPDWTEPQVVGTPDPGEEAALGAVGLVRLNDGTLLLPFNSVTWTPGLGTEGRQVRLRLARSDDDGQSWGRGAIVDVDFAWPAVYGQILELDDGELLWPVWGRLESGEKWRSTVLSSRDGGTTWAMKGTIAFDPDARLQGEYADTGNTDRADIIEIGDPEFRPHDPTDGFTETSVLHLADGRLLAILRQQGVGGDQTLLFFRAWSEDRGATWTSYESTGFTGMSPALATLPDGRLLLAYRRCAPPGTGAEPGVDVRVGAPDGSLWGEPVALEHPVGQALTAEYQCGYPAIVVEEQGIRIFFYTYEPEAGRFVAWNRIAVSPSGTKGLPE